MELLCSSVEGLYTLKMEGCIIKIKCVQLFVCVCEFEHVGASLFNYVCVYVGGWADVCICVLVEQAEPRPGTGLGRILTQTVCSNETSTRDGIVKENPRECERVKICEQ